MPTSSSIRCRLHLHHMVAFSTSDGGRWKHCSRCGKDWDGAGAGGPLWTYDMGRRGEMGF